MCYILVGDFMKTDIIYNNETLFIYLEGKISKKKIKDLKRKISNIISEYQINDIVIDTSNIKKINNMYLEELINDGNLNIKLF